MVDQVGVDVQDEADVRRATHGRSSLQDERRHVGDRARKVQAGWGA
jgi:hypothetical protein